MIRNAKQMSIDVILRRTSAWRNPNLAPSAPIYACGFAAVYSHKSRIFYHPNGRAFYHGNGPANGIQNTVTENFAQPCLTHKN